MKVRAGQTYTFRRSLADVMMSQHCADVQEGELVRVIQLPSAPRPNTMGQAHIERATDRTFLGMCSTNSLVQE